MNKQLNSFSRDHIINLHKRNYSAEQIADIYEITKKTVYNIINKYEQTKSVERTVGSGRKSNDAVWFLIKNIVDDDRKSSLKNISNILSNDYQIECPKSTVHYYLMKNDYINKNSIKKPFMTDKHLNDRQNWAIYYQYYNWEKVIWSDETMICIQSNTPSKIWIHKNENEIIRVFKNPIKIHVWGCILKNHNLILHICDKTMNSDNYIEILELKLLPILKKYKQTYTDNLLFQQDNASCHTSFKLLKYFSEKKIEVMFWPPCSPDLSPIENVWNLLKRSVGKINVTNKKELINIIITKSKMIRRSTINNIINSMNNRIEELYTNNFDYINY
jgi:transposase